MAAHAGERAEKTGTFHCDSCGETVRVSKGDKIPKCPSCSGSSYDRRTGEPGSKG
jgi:Zn finger protein HypA/HybF involved in hydrogenase expression